MILIVKGFIRNICSLASTLFYHKYVKIKHCSFLKSLMHDYIDVVLKKKKIVLHVKNVLIFAAT